MTKTFYEKINSIMSVNKDPCISFYVPVQKVGADTRQGGVVLKKLIRAAEEKLKERGMRSAQIQPLLEPVKELAENVIFWEHQMEGLALFLNQDDLVSWQLPMSVSAQVSVMDRFLIRPLLPMLVQDGNFYLVALGRRETKLFLCSRSEVQDLKVEGLPESLKQIYDQYEDQKQLQHHTSSGQGGGSQSSVYHGGASSLKDNDKKRIEEYFRQIDASLAKILAAPKTPLVLACVDYLFPLYKHVARTAQLMDTHISGSPDLTRPDLLKDEAWKMVGPLFEKPKQKAWRNAQNLQGTARLVSDIRLIFAALRHGRVDTLFVKENSLLYGSYDETTGAIKKNRPEEATESDDLLDLAARKTLQSSGQVYVMEPSEMSEQVDCLAMLRY